MTQSIYRIFLIAICTFIYTGTVSGQHSIHMDKSYYVTGEYIWYNISYDGNIADGTVINCLITDHTGNVVHSSFAQVTRKSLDGYFKIPFNLKSGAYALVTQAKSDNTISTLSETPVYIYSDLGNGNPTEYNTLALPTAPAPTGLNVDISRSASGTTSLTVTDNNGNPVTADLSVTIVDNDVVRGPNEGAISFSTGTIPTNLSDKVFLTGVVMDKEGSPVKANVLGAYSKSDGTFSFGKSNAQGKFIIPSDLFSGSKTVQLVGYQNEYPEIQSRINDKVALSTTISNALPYNKDIENYILLSSQRKKINQHFKVDGKQRIEKDLSQGVHEHKVQAEYKVEEYQSFGDVDGFVSNLMMPLRFKGSKGERTATIINPRAKKTSNYFLEGIPLFVVDGKITRNADFIGSMDQEEVINLNIVYDKLSLRKQFNAFGSSGVVIINTHGKAEKLPSIDENNIYLVNGIQNTVTYPVQFLADQDQSLPQLDPQLYWNPSITTDSNGKASIPVVQADDRSNYKVVVVARDSSGNIGTSSYVYSYLGESK